MNMNTTGALCWRCSGCGMLIPVDRHHSCNADSIVKLNQLTEADVRRIVREEILRAFVTMRDELERKP